jgi:CRISPR-associated protein Cmr2
MTYTAVTFAPVQSFIRSSRKLRDLYGSSLLLSHLSRAIAEDAQQRRHTVISPALVNSSRGVPNVLVIEGAYSRGQAHEALIGTWKHVLKACRSWVEEALPLTDFQWQSSWNVCASHTWELFHGQGCTIKQARESLAVNKQQRAWSVPNWTGESSTLSSAEAVVWPEMGAVRDPRELPAGLISKRAREFLSLLRQHHDLGEAFAGNNEEISMTELVKRLITYPAIAQEALATERDPNPNMKALIPNRFQDLSMVARENHAETNNQSESIVWFMADGDGIGDHLQSLAHRDGEKQALQSFSQAMRSWAAGLYERVPAVMMKQAMIVYAGGDDLLGALHETEPGANDLSTDQLWRWLRQFPQIWQQCEQKNLTVSMGLVWADAKVPQREALQHARKAEASAKDRGKNRFALRLLYASGNHLEWTCPWEWIDPILRHYTDREGRSIKASHDGRPPSWRHLAEDLEWLRSRQAITVNGTSALAASGRAAKPNPVSDALLNAYFPGWRPPRDPEEGEGRTLDHWLLDLSRVMAGLEKHRPKTAWGAQR